MGPQATPRPVRGAGSQIYALSYRVLELLVDALEDLVENTKIRCALVIDRTGCIMASAGDFGAMNPSTLGATAAATIAALNTMVARANTPEVSVKFYGGEVDNIHFVLIEERLVLCLLYGSSASTGEVRDGARKFVQAVGVEIEQDKRNTRQENKSLLESVNYIESKLDELFKDHLGGLP